ncbi:1-phosphofructokinase [Halanaerobium hydrogeniformans]|uniref:Tagatose-6-phosphate kinase n=1 Tax=Halanaerobium hydrogeniformans TaxID=656519 RepID=E4RNI3_HALHG|nr:1-phosphofructokinase [Halanaerobium hydrogeniformans]ADQ13518.1 1-phosphofructokinase [Halanaerobium hydrogeniformans]
MILTVTLNPAVDKIIILDKLKLGKLNRVKDAKALAGGKGINVSEVLSALGVDNTALAIVGGDNGNLINNYLEKRGVKTDFQWSNINTRQNLKIKENNSNRETEINETGRVTKKDIKAFKKNLDKYLTADNTIVLSGSLPEGVNKDIYAELIEKAVTQDAKVILDSSGEEFKQAINKAPYLVKPNLAEIENLLSTNIESDADLKKGAEYLLKKGIKIVMISLGAEGAFIASKDEAYRLYTPEVEVAQTTVGAGDTMVAGLAAEIDKNSSLKETAVYASALATVFVKSGSIENVTKEQLNEIRNTIKVKKIY